MTVRDVRVNQGWFFHRDESSNASLSTPYAGSVWQSVDLPHSARLEDDTAKKIESFQGVVWYKKAFTPAPEWDGKRVVLRFDGAMQTASVWVNGEFRLRHTGGYLPFELDLTQDVAKQKDFVVEVGLDNRDDASFPPGRPQSRLDFTYAGGLYRDVWLEVTEKSHIDDVYVVSQNVTKTGADVVVRVGVSQPRTGQQLKVQLVDPRKVVAGHAEIAASTQGVVQIHVNRPLLWGLDRPFLYEAVTQLTDSSTVVDELRTKFGIRHFEFSEKTGFSINGEPVRLEGSNRHMAFPVIGNAASDAAQFREARRLKSLGLNILRLAHYPQSPAFLDACDALGLLVIDPIPGWQFFQDTPEFRSHVLQDIKDLVTRDRNHPCVAVFETCLNETYNVPDEFWLVCNRVAHDTFGNGNFFTGGDSYGKRDYSRPIWDVPWTGWDEDSFSRPALFKMQKGVDREYGDYEFGGEQSTSRADRGAGEDALMLQAWNFIWSHNRNRGNNWSYGDLTWEAIDTVRGLNPQAPVSKSGLLDLYRLPKPVAFFFQSQGQKQPMVHIANLWTQRPSPTKVVVFSNCDEVALLLNGKEVARQAPDHGPTTGYIGPLTADPMYWAHSRGEVIPPNSSDRAVGGAPGALPFNGGNCEHLSHPPFTFDGASYEAGKLEAVGYRAGKEVARDVVYTPGKPVKLVIKVDTRGRPLEADGSDFVFVTVEVQDENNQPLPTDHRPIVLTVKGAGTLLGSGNRPAVAGVAPFMIQSQSKPGVISLEAKADGLPPVRTGIRTITP